MVYRPRRWKIRFWFLKRKFCGGRVLQMKNRKDNFPSSKYDIEEFEELMDVYKNYLRMDYDVIIAALNRTRRW